MANQFNVYELIDVMRRRPEMYIGSHSIVHFRAFLEGCFHMARVYGIECCEQPDFSDLHYWISERFLGTQSTMGWCSIILQECGGDENKALDQFFELVEEFRNSEYQSGIYPDRR
jgi:hypothetical protein